MTVKKFRSFDEASTDLWIMEPNDAYYEKVRMFLDAWSQMLVQPTFRSLTKFRSVQEAERNKKPFHGEVREEEGGGMGEGG